MSEKKESIVERTDSRGLVEITIPWIGRSVEVKFPGTNRSIMVIICTFLCAMTIILPVCSYVIIVLGNTENIRALPLLGETSDIRKPEKIQVHTEDGIEVIEACPPCPLCMCPDDEVNAGFKTTPVDDLQL